MVASRFGACFECDFISTHLIPGILYLLIFMGPMVRRVRVFLRRVVLRVRFGVYGMFGVLFVGGFVVCLRGPLVCVSMRVMSV